ncbi:MAG: M48 family metallopeptidase [Anaerolineales bacterium]|nr:M48 family metallopeptidase [Anaerolineales bacterium]MDW8162075.1 M48 family metallopeptidase [Anaerolineales bacterium]
MEPITPDPERQEKARQYARISRRLLLINLLLGAGYALAWLAFGWSKQWDATIQSLTPNPWLQVPLYLLGFGGLFYLINLPLAWYESYYLPHRFELSTQTMRGWILDQVKGLGVGGLLGLLVLEIIYAILRASPQTWWIWATLFLLFLNVVLAYLAPVLLFPIFNKFKPLGEEHADLVERLKRLGERAGTQVEGVYEMDMSRRTKAANAALTGLGRTRRIILGDTLLREFSPDEIETVLAHELGHHVHKDIPLLMAVSALLTIVGMYLVSVVMAWGVPFFGFTSVGEVGTLPLLMLGFGAFQLVVMPLVNAFSRWRERLADRYAIQVTGKPAVYAAALARLADQNLAEADPEPWVEFLLYSHPPINKRIAMAKEYM